MATLESISVDVRDDALLVTVACAELDDERADELEDKVSSAAGQVRGLPVILDLSQVERMADDSLGALVDLLNQCKQRGQRFILAGLRPGVLEILSVTSLGKLFEYREDVADALVHLREV
jgi:anti-anti-sigma factor